MFQLSTAIFKRLDPGSSHPTGSLPIRRGPRLARDDTVWGPGGVCFRDGLPKSVRQRQRSCLLERDLRSLWQTDFATPSSGGYPPNCAMQAPVQYRRSLNRPVLGAPFHHFTFPPSKYPDDPVDPVIRVLFLFHHATTSPPPSYPTTHRGKAPICSLLTDR